MGYTVSNDELKDMIDKAHIIYTLALMSGNSVFKVAIEAKLSNFLELQLERAEIKEQ